MEQKALTNEEIGAQIMLTLERHSGCLEAIADGMQHGRDAAQALLDCVVRLQEENKAFRNELVRLRARVAALECRKREWFE